MESVQNSGLFSELSCPRLLVHLHLANFTGTLRISQGALLKLLYFRGGAIAMASSNDQGDHLAPILMRAGKLKSEQLELARKQIQPGTSLARVLVQMGFLTSGELFAGARQQLRQIVAGVLGATEGRYEIQKDYFPREITSLNVDTRELLLDLLAEIPERSFVLLEVGAPDTVFMPATPPPSSGARGASLPSVWQRYSDGFDGPMTIHAFGQAAGLDDFSASKVVYALHLFGILEPRPAEQEAEPPSEPGVASPILPGPPEEEEISLSEDVPAEDAPLASGSGPEPPAAPSGGTGIEASSPGEPPETSETSAPAEAAGAPPVEPAIPPPEPDHAAGSSGSGPSPGEIVSRGQPIRLEFKGALPEPERRPRRSGSWGIFSIFGGFILLAAAFAGFIFLKGSQAPGDVSPAALERQKPSPAAAPAHAAAPATPPATGEEPATAGPGSPVPEPASPAPGEGASSPQVTEEAPSGSEAGATEAARAAPVASKPAPASPPEEKAVADLPPFGAADLFFEGRKLLDGGDPLAAASAWSKMVQKETRNHFTLQLAIACQEESLQKAARRTTGSAQFFAVPFTLQGRACFRLCWGSYPTLEKAQAAKASVPGFFQGEGASPVVVSLSRLVPAVKP